MTRGGGDIEAMTSIRFSTLFDSVFEYLFLQFAGTDRLHLALDLDEEGNWKDIGIVESLAIGYDPE
jgi:hypothetical protein